MRVKSFAYGATALALAFSVFCVTSTTRGQDHSSLPPNCDRACLVEFMNKYLTALVTRDPSRVPWADKVEFTENNVRLMIGDGSWAVATGKGNNDLIVADPLTGQVGYFGTVELNGLPTWFAARLKVADAKVTELETVWRPRLAVLNPAAPAGGDPKDLKHDPAMYDSLAPSERVPRRKMIDLANGYFATLQLNDGTLYTEFDPTCSRIDNGTKTASNPDSPNPAFRLNCGDQFKTGMYAANDAVRERDFFLVDEEKGIVMARAFLDHNAVVQTIKLTDGTQIHAGFRTPNSFVMLEMFKFRNGKLYRAEVVHADTNYHASSPWTPRSRRD
ncbi:MAG TPA: hypothetical protein VI216_03795 [Candidatus Acidoferrales bacterium]